MTEPRRVLTLKLSKLKPSSQPPSPGTPGDTILKLKLKKPEVQGHSASNPSSIIATPAKNDEPYPEPSPHRPSNPTPSRSFVREKYKGHICGDTSPAPQVPDSHLLPPLSQPPSSPVQTRFEHRDRRLHQENLAARDLLPDRVSGTRFPFPAPAPSAQTGLSPFFGSLDLEQDVDSSGSTRPLARGRPPQPIGSSHTRTAHSEHHHHDQPANRRDSLASIRTIDLELASPPRTAGFCDSSDDEEGPDEAEEKGEKLRSWPKCWRCKGRLSEAPPCECECGMPN